MDARTAARTGGVVKAVKLQLSCDSGLGAVQHRHLFRLPELARGLRLPIGSS